jgi:alpha-L-fucosidase
LPPWPIPRARKSSRIWTRWKPPFPRRGRPWRRADRYPRNKQEIGRRLALWALAKDYGQKDLVYCGPRYKSVKADAGKRVLAAKNAGMKYLVITAKHHDGFAMFKSAASPFNIVDATPFGRDPLKELAEACRKHDMKLGFYYSQNYDWHHPGGALNDWDPAIWGAGVRRSTSAST